MNPDEVLVVYCTCPSDEVAQQLAHALVSASLVACVNVMPGVSSVYRWEGAVCSEREVLLMMKTNARQYAALERFIVEQHPYDVPEILALPVVAGNADDLQWVRNACAPLGTEK